MAGQSEPPVAINSVPREMNAQDKDGKEDTDNFFHPCSAPVRLTTVSALKTLQKLPSWLWDLWAEGKHRGPRISRETQVIDSSTLAAP